MSGQTERLLQELVNTSFNFSNEPIYPLASGVLSRYYIDCKIALSYPAVRELIGELIFEHVRSNSIDAVGGLALGAYPIAVAVSDAFYRQSGEVVRAFVVRKEAKAHGLKKHIEGDVRKGDKVLIVDDVITSGKSTIDAIVKSREEGLQVMGVVAIVDRQECNGAENIKNYGVPFKALVNLQNLHDAYLSMRAED